MHVQFERVTSFDDIPEKGRAIILYLTKIANGIALALDFRQADGVVMKTRRLLERSPRSEKSAARLARDLATITNTRCVYVINRDDDPETGIKG